MFGLGAQEMVIIAVVFLIVFGPNKLPQMARDVGKFMAQARGAIDDFKSELTLEESEEKEKRRSSARKKREKQDEELEPSEDAERSSDKIEHDL
ncbi:MAG: twin-arginine translocase subunit TatB [Rubrobacter sp.]|nr:twin-arginine translocase subunit TatB [Rubrobacter sp.]